MNTKFTLGFAIITGKQNRGLINDKFEIIRLGKFIQAEVFTSPNKDFAVFSFTKEDWSCELFFVSNNKILSHMKDLYNIHDNELGIKCEKWDKGEFSGLIGWNSIEILPFEYDSIDVPNYDGFVVTRKENKDRIIKIEDSKIITQPWWNFERVYCDKHEEFDFMFGCIKENILYLYDANFKPIDIFDIHLHNDCSFDISTYNSKERSIEFSENSQECDGYYHADYKLIHNSNPAEPDTVIELYVESYSIYDKENDRNSYYDAYEDDPSAEWR